MMKYIIIFGFLSSSLIAQSDVTYDQLNETSIEELLDMEVKTEVKEVFKVENNYSGLEDLSLESLMKIAINKSKVEQRPLSMEELENVSMETLMNVDASMTTDQGVQSFDIDMTDLSIDEIMKISTKVSVEIKKERVM